MMVMWETSLKVWRKFFLKDFAINCVIVVLKP